jgi:filamentous hemagglutinin family protein
MIHKRYKKLPNLFALLITLCSGILLQTVHANPEGGVVSSGDAVINSSQSQVEITQQSPKAVIDWQSFNIEANEKTKFIQPSNDAIALNRIHSNTASEIKGELTANGKLILINQNGILFGQTAKVDVNGLIATTANISDDKFMQQDLAANSNLFKFDEPGVKDSKIINEGQITAKDGLVGLVAPHVVNAGLIIAKAAKVHLASGETFALDLYGDNLINVAISDDLENQLVLNSGKIVADGNKIALTAAAGKQLVNSLIANSGALQAKSIANNNGEIIIMAEGSNAVINNAAELKGIKSGESKILVSGTIDVSGLEPGESGGKVQILGDNIGLIDNAVINASGHTGKYNTTLGLDNSAKRTGSAGGEILVGGDYLGKGKVPAARMLTVDPTVTIYSDSNEIGDAGRIIFWSDGVNKFNGKVYARSLGGITGNNYGNGGFVETSGKQLIVNGYVDLTAANGSVGTYLLDPSSITVHNSNVDLSSYVAVPYLDYDPITSGDSHIHANYLGNLNANVALIADNIILDLSGDSITLTNDRSFHVRSRISFSVPSSGSVNTTRTNTDGNIIIINEGGNIDLTNLDLVANNNGSISLASFNGTITLGNTTAGSFTVCAVGPNGAIYQNASKKKIMAQDTNWTADQKVELLADDVFVAGQNSTFGSLVINTNELQTSSTTTSIPFDISGGNVVVNSGKTNVNFLNLNANSGNVNINAFGNVTLGSITANTLTVQASQDLSGYYSTSNITVSGKKLAVQNIIFNTDFNVYLNLLANDNTVANYNTLTVNARNGIFNNTPDSIVNVIGNVNLSAQEVNIVGLGLNSGANNITITANHGAVTLGNLTANNVLVRALSYAGDIIFPNNAQITANGANNPLVLVAEGSIKNQNPAGFNVLNVTNSNARWLLYSSNPKSDQNVAVSFIGAHNFLYSRRYAANLLPTETGNLLIYASTDPATFPQLDGNYNDKNVAEGKEITVADLTLNGVNANNYNLSSTQSVGSIGKIIPKDVSIALTGTVQKVYDGSATATNVVYNPMDATVNNYTVTGFVSADVPDGIGLDNYSVGNYYNQAGTNLDRTVGVGKLLKVDGVTLAGAEVNNYNLLSGSASANVGVITPKPLRVVLTDNNSQNPVDKIYDGSTTAVVKSINYQLTGLVTVNNVADNVLLSNVGN